MTSTTKALRSWFHHPNIFGRMFAFINVFLMYYSSAVGIATRYGAGRSGDRIPARSEIFRTRPDRPWGPPSLLYNGYRVFPGGKAAGAWRRTLTPPSAEVKERVELYLYSTSGPSWPVIGWILPLSLHLCNIVRSQFIQSLDIRAFSCSPYSSNRVLVIGPLVSWTCLSSGVL